MARPKMTTHHPRLMHVMPYGIGDSLGVLVRLILSLCWGIDQNGQVDANKVVWIMHWPRIGKNGMRWLWTGEYDKHHREVRRKLTKDERNRLIQHCPTQWVKRLRSDKSGGRRLYTAHVHMAKLATLNAERIAAGKTEKVWSLEAKGNPLFLHPETWQFILAGLESTGVACTVMTLQRTQADSHRAYSVLKLAHDLCGPRLIGVAVLPRAAKPSDFDAVWAPIGIQVWGRWR